MRSSTMQGLLLIAFLLFVTTPAQEKTLCFVPNGGGTSFCVMTRECPSLWAVVMRNVRGVQDADLIYLDSFSCAEKPGLVCCPDNADKSSHNIVKKPVEPQVSDFPSRSDLTDIASHPNIGMLNQDCGGLENIRIIGGTTTQVGEFRWVVLLQYETGEAKNFGCGGTLISPSYVLTAAHCIKRSLLSVRLGEYNTSTEVDCKVNAKECQDPVQDIEIERIIAYPTYNQTIKINDIALLRLRRPADVRKNNVRTICLPTKEENQVETMDSEQDFIIAGWGVTEERTPSNVMMKAKIPKMEKSECASRLGKHIPVYDTYICAGGITKIDTCFGDSGGPLFALAEVDGKHRAVQYGIVASGVGCEDLRDIYPGVYTNIAFYMKWILDSMKP